MILPHDSVAAKSISDAFCIANGIRLPSYEFRPTQKQVGFRNYGLYRSGSETLIVNALRCKGPSRSPYSWTWPGYTADLTVLGVTAHELGHHVQWVLGWGDIKRKWHSMVMGDLLESPVGSYALTQNIEDFAESFKVFVTNPSLLEAVAPKRYGFMRHGINLQPVESRHWREILEDSPRHVKAVENKMVGT